MGEESKPVPVPDTGAEGENDAPRPVIADLIRNPEGRQGDTGEDSTNPLPSFPRRREITGWMCRGRHTGFKAVSTGRQGDTGEQDNTNLPRHSRVGGKPQGGCVVAVILALRQYPQGGRVTRVNKTKQPTESPLP